MSRCVGLAEFTDGETKIYADELEWFRGEKRVVASGNVVFSQGRNQIAADKAEFSTETRLGTFYDARGVAPIKPQRPSPSRAGGLIASGATHEDTEVHFFGEIIEKTGPKKYKITDGGFTTCLQPVPRWNLTSGTIVLKPDDYTLLHHAVFNVKGVPLLYVPILYYPTNKEDRATGFLLPTYGSTTLRGQTLTNRFFWAIDRSHDATFRHDWFSNTGHRFGAEYRYALSSGEAVAEALLLRDRETVFSSGGTLPEDTSFYIRAAGNQRFPGGLRAQMRIDYPSSIRSARTASSSLTDLSQHQRTYGGNIAGSWRHYSLNGTFERTEYFTSDESSNVTGGTPRVTFSGSDQPLLGRSGLYGSFTSELAHLDRQTRSDGVVVDDRTLSRFDFAPTLRYPFKEWQWLTVNSSVSWRETFYSQSQDPITRTVLDDSLNRQFVSVQADALGPVFNRVWDTPDNGYAEKFKHTIEPFLNFRRTTSVEDFERIIRIDAIDASVGGTTTYTYGLNNRFYAKRRLGETSQAQEIARVELSQSYYTDERASQCDPNYNTSCAFAEPSNFSPVRLVVRATPATGLDGTMRAEFDSKTRELRTLSADTSYNWTSGSVAVRWNQTFFIEGLPGFDNPDFLRRYLTVDSRLRTRDNRVGGNYSFNFDAAEGRMQQQTFSGYYNAQCCGIALQYQRLDYGAGLSPIPFDRRFFVTFTLAGLGSFSPFDGAPGGFR